LGCPLGYPFKHGASNAERGGKWSDAAAISAGHAEDGARSPHFAR
jgi:hypothetical protein